MIEAAPSTTSAQAVEDVLRHELAQGDAVQGTVAPVLRHLLSTSDNAVFSDEILARVRGMKTSLAMQLLDALAAAGGEVERHDHDLDDLFEMAETLAANPAMLGHLHALALEWQLTERLQRRLALDPVLSPLLQSLVASSEPNTAATAMKLVAAQARFIQTQRRMAIALHELPGDLFHGALLAMRTLAGAEPEIDERAARAEQTLRKSYVEADSRLGLIAQLVTGMGSNAGAALGVADAGAAMFLSALSLASGQDRDLSVMTTNESQLARLALSLRAAGMKPASIEEQLMALHGDIALPEGFALITSDRAAGILALSAGFAG